MVMGDVDDIGESERSGIPDRRLRGQRTHTSAALFPVDAWRDEAMADRVRAPTLEVAHRNAAGIDIGSGSHFVAVRADVDERPVREFLSFTEDLEALAQWLTQCGVDVVAMESTGVYWIALYELLESRGFTVHLVNSRHVKNVSGRKSDVLDCQWLQQLMSYGLLTGAFRPQEEICVLRSVARQRDMLVQYQSKHIQHMQKALTQMNVQLDNVISDLVGATGQKIVRAIVAGERDALKLARMRDVRIRASEADIVKSLQGNWRAEHLFALKQAVSLYDSYQASIAECDVQLAEVLGRLATHDDAPEAPKSGRGRPVKVDKFDLRKALYRACGVDLTRIEGIDVSTALTMIAEVGPDLSRFKTVKHFASWLGLCPGTKISGGKVLSGASKRIANRLAQALRISAVAAGKSRSALGAYYRRLSARLGKAKAVRATAHKLARLIYTLMTKGEAYVDQGQDYYEQQHQQRVLKNLKKKALEMGFSLTPVAAA
jgi:transposase